VKNSLGIGIKKEKIVEEVVLNKPITAECKSFSE
jgi:hypothetical protein